ncbi:alanine/glycine:cation symporter family protein [Marinigracilibium pacificum]|uniref:Sodium:alanine symporter family protein n=1 Tax=Marinigracilibium pacificum TaxID=2729599 RepID=A0A848J4U2_9BACT|nr:sodium:alanine symporter family protein [Marinigracilibium pacificum]NMM48182.1 sodium:alanine symporter family protein [Marinigracilibium pacificum]
MQELNSFLEMINSFVGEADWFLFLLLGTGLFFTIYLGFPQIKYFRHAINVVMGKYDKKGEAGDASHFQALTTALSGTVGTGNIGGVALALHIGGPAALFWMLVTAFFGMTTKFVEVTLSHKYREKTADGTMAGGPMYYMKHANFKLFNINFNPVSRVLAVVFALATILSSFGTGNMPQINNIASSIKTTFDIDPLITGSILSVLLALVIIGGIKRIVKVTEKLVPSMAIIYFIGAFSVIFYNFENILPSLASIFTNAFTGTAVTGGFLGAGFKFAFNNGVARGLFSNEAGQGSAPIAHAAARTEEPVSEGMVAILEPFIDTIIICTITGLVLLTSGAWNQKFQNEFDITDIEVIDRVMEENPENQRAIFRHLEERELLNHYTGDLKIEEGKFVDDVTVIHARSFAENVFVTKDGEPYTGIIPANKGDLSVPDGIAITGKSLIHSAPLTTEAFRLGFLGDWGKYIVSLGMLLFAFSTAISWSYYGDRATTFLFGNKYVIIYRVFYVVAFFIAAFVEAKIIWTIAGITIALMTLPNLIGLALLHKEMKSTVNDYWTKFKSK